ncbi:uncharacterized protein A4U43_C04F23450 [Asparagus officinalis]|uniref:Uncharacterized protein n=1 Tax=Asparagus officinalis TaxID=4686 RepID=A0A5P1F368_ASPOF|nr:uncharacterized protein A4U43_C04F23450 [Asparagus officinalis]
MPVGSCRGTASVNCHPRGPESVRGIFDSRGDARAGAIWDCRWGRRVLEQSRGPPGGGGRRESIRCLYRGWEISVASGRGGPIGLGLPLGIRGVMGNLVLGDVVDDAPRALDTVYASPKIVYISAVDRQLAKIYFMNDLLSRNGFSSTSLYKGDLVIRLITFVLKRYSG